MGWRTGEGPSLDGWNIVFPSRKASVLIICIVSLLEFSFLVISEVQSPSKGSLKSLSYISFLSP